MPVAGRRRLPESLRAFFLADLVIHVAHARSLADEYREEPDRRERGAILALRPVKRSKTL
jgi:hypothetical protein